MQDPNFEEQQSLFGVHARARVVAPVLQHMSMLGAVERKENYQRGQLSKSPGMLLF